MMETRTDKKDVMLCLQFALRIFLLTCVLCTEHQEAAKQAFSFQIKPSLSFLLTDTSF